MDAGLTHGTSGWPAWAASYYFQFMAEEWMAYYSKGHMTMHRSSEVILRMAGAQ
jgi:hypothetical protein